MKMELGSKSLQEFMKSYNGIRGVFDINSKALKLIRYFVPKSVERQAKRKARVIAARRFRVNQRTQFVDREERAAQPPVA